MLLMPTSSMLVRSAVETVDLACFHQLFFDDGSNMVKFGHFHATDYKEFSSAEKPLWTVVAQGA